MNLAALLPLERVCCNAQINSKKRALHELSELLAMTNPILRVDEVFDSLLIRERLGSTGLGKGVAIPHGRLVATKTTSAALALITLKKGIDYDAPDTQPVDIFFALIVPEQSTDKHLHILAHLAEMMSDEHFVGRLRDQKNCQSLHTLVNQWHGTSTTF
jgi:PTS system nitrogen regulatory IIA component